MMSLKSSEVDSGMALLSAWRMRRACWRASGAVERRTSPEAGLLDLWLRLERRSSATWKGSSEELRDLLEERLEEPERPEESERRWERGDLLLGPRGERGERELRGDLRERCFLGARTLRGLEGTAGESSGRALGERSGPG